MKSNALLPVLLCLALQSPAPAQEKQAGKKTSEVGPERTFTDEEQKLLDEAEKRTKLAYELQACGKFAEAEKEHRVVLVIRERVLGAKDAYILRTCYQLALCLEAQRKFPEALAFIHRLEDGEQEVFRTDHPVLRAGKQARERIEAAMKANAPNTERKLTAEEQKLLDEARGRSEKVGMLLKLCKYADAEREFRAMITLRERIPRTKRPHIFSRRNQLTITLDGQGPCPESEWADRAMQAIQEREMGVENPHEFPPGSKLDLCYKMQRKLPKPLTFIQRGGSGVLRVFGADDPRCLLATLVNEWIAGELKEWK